MLLRLTGFSTKVTVSMLEFDRLLTKVTVVVLGFAGFATRGITLELDGLLASVTVVVLGFAGFSVKVTVTTVSGFCTKVTVWAIGLVVGEIAADSVAATKVTVAVPFELLSVRDDSAEGSCLDWLTVTVTAELRATDGELAGLDSTDAVIFASGLL